eukprot:TRINITY_DN7532_c0_g2_i4.p1 TRINITY_DN7532_c0_g2~~TRINITY_DN7532_c0_g2_i4.p1  ORF type:complete len:459 (+),score=96.92 TRINITY_DN7532_c0_g2_i4:184-1377(+)
MGGGSTSTFRVTADKTGLFNGTCAIVGFLKAPGFAKIVGSKKFADITGYDNIALKVRSSTPDYKGFKVAFAAPGIPKTSVFGGASYKADFQLNGGDWQVVEVPLTQFSYDWSSYTGRCDTKDPDSMFGKGQQHYCCDKSGLKPSKPDVCVQDKFLKSIDGLEVWAEGVQGDFNLEIEWIGATKNGVGDAQSSAALVTFDGAPGTSFTFKELNDPVMGGKSTGTWSLGQGFGILDGEVVDVPSLKAPGFIKAAADGSFRDISAFADGSLVLKVRTTTPDYAGFRVSFASGAMSPSFACAGGGGLPFSRGCFKQKFTVPAGGEFIEVKLPFNTFSDKWSSATGEQTDTCAKNKDVCPTAAKLAKIQRVEFWGEGASGKLHLEVQSVLAEKASGERIVLV